MPIIGLTTFRGLVPKLDPRRLGPEQAQIAENCNLLPNILAPFYRPLAAYTLPNTSQKSIYLWRRNDDEEWLYWSKDIDVIKGPVRDDQYDRIYYSGDGDIRIKGWDDGVSDRVASLPSPEKITVTKSDLFTVSSSTISGTYSDDAGTTVMSLVGYSREEDQLLITFHMPSHLAGSMESSWRYRLTLAGVGSVPHSATAESWELFSDTLDLTDAGVKYGKFQVIGREYTNYDWEVDVANTGYTIPFDVIFTIKMNYERATTQYVYYVSTFVDDWGMEGPPCQMDDIPDRIGTMEGRVHYKDVVSELIEWDPGERLTLSLPGATPGGYNLEKRRIYRSAAGTNEDAFFYVDEVAQNINTYVDNKTDAMLAEPMPLTQNPPDGLQGLIVMPGGFTAAFKGKELYLSPLYLPHSYPDEYRMTFAWDVVSIASSGNDIVVMTKGNPYYVTGSDPAQMTQTELMINQSCVSKLGVASVGGLVVYPSPDGMVGVENGSAKLISEGYYNPKDWRALTPSSMIAAAHDKKLFAFFSGTALIWDFDQGPSALVTTDETATGLYTDLEDDTLYMIQGNEITAWEGSTVYMTAKWQSSEFESSSNMKFNSGRVEAQTYDNCILRVYSQGSDETTPRLVSTIDVIDGTAFRLAILRPERVWQIEIENDSPVTKIVIATSMQLIKTR